jgi:pimeloyl-ACP methyl ester carboxylesterase
MILRRVAVLAVLLVMISPMVRSTAATSAPRMLTGTIAGAAYIIEVPTPWNGTLALYSHFYLPPGAPNPAVDARDPVIGAWLLAHGYAIAGSAYTRGTGWTVEQPIKDQIALLDLFTRQVGAPRRTIAWGQSMGGLISAGLVQQFPTRISGALAMCGPVAGAAALWNGYLDNAFALKTLLAPASGLQVVHIISPTANLQQSEEILAAAQRTPQGRARLALAAALGGIPGWVDAASPEPAPEDVAAQERNQFTWEHNYIGPFTFALRAELEQRAGGNPSANTDVNYAAVLAHSADRAEIQTLYHQAGLDLARDLATLQQAPRIAADPGAVAYLRRNMDLNGQIQVPVLTMHTLGDGIIPVATEQVYARAVAAAGHGDLLRQVFVQRAHHCSFLRAETLAAFQTLVHRLDTGRWGTNTTAQQLNREATALEQADPALARLAPLAGFYTTTQPFTPGFVRFQPATFLGLWRTRAQR